MSESLLFVLASLASYRLWRLVGHDAITEGARDLLAVDWEQGWRGKIREGVECPWCLGSWVTFAVFAVLAQIVDVPLPVLQALAGACVVGFLGRLDD